MNYDEYLLSIGDPEAIEAERKIQLRLRAERALWRFSNDIRSAKKGKTSHQLGAMATKLNKKMENL